MRKDFKMGLVARRAALAASVLMASLAAAAPFTPAAQAALDGCRADPVIYLSDGTALDVTADISGSVADITTIAYTVHMPAGVHAILYLATPTLGFRGKEIFTVYNDAPAGTYQTDTYVATKSATVPVTVRTSLVGVYLLNLKLSLQSKPVTGTSGNHLWTYLSR
jgi:hypothetical protein